MSTPIALLLLGAGVVLMVSAYRNENPVDVVYVALTGLPRRTTSSGTTNPDGSIGKNDSGVL